MTAAVSNTGGNPLAPARDRLRAIAIERFERSADVSTHFVHGHASLIARACLEMSHRFRRGGRLLALGQEAAASDAAHIVVEFAHPIIVGKRALAAIPLSDDHTSNRPPFVQTLALLGQPSDIAVCIAHDDGGRLAPALRAAREAGMLTIALLGASQRATVADFEFAVPTNDVLVAQEVHELLYHVLWELVHVFMEHRS